MRESEASFYAGYLSTIIETVADSCPTLEGKRNSITALVKMVRPEIIYEFEKYIHEFYPPDSDVYRIFLKNDSPNRKENCSIPNL